MAEDEPRKSWWHTLPGIITSITATITALGGLVVAINQTNWFSGPERDAVRAEAEDATEAASSRSGALPQSAPVVDTAADPGGPALPPDEPAAADEPASGGGPTVTLPAMRTHTLSDVEFTVLDAALAPRNSQDSTLTLRVRLLNNRNYAVNFWDSQFRLLVDGVPRAPNSGLNTIVQGNAAEDGEIRFNVPRSATHPRLRILFDDERTDIPLTLAHGE
jgi:hypothetical protein